MHTRLSMCRYACVQLPSGARTSSQAEVAGGWELGGRGARDLGPLQEQHGLLPAKPSLQPSHPGFWLVSGCVWFLFVRQGLSSETHQMG